MADQTRKDLFTKMTTTINNTAPLENAPSSDGSMMERHAQKLGGNATAEKKGPNGLGAISSDPEMGQMSSVRDLEILVPDCVDPVFEAKAALVNHAINVIGMGRHQWILFIVCGFGYIADQLVQTAIGDALPQVGLEFNAQYPAFLTLASIAGLVVGASFWGFGSDIIGRRFAFNCTLFIASVFLIAMGAGPNFAGTAVLASFVGFGAGGNIVVDTNLFLEFLPGNKQYMVAILSTWWSIGLVIPTFAAWGLVSNYSCPADTPAGQCFKENNMGWRYFLYTMGGFLFILFIIRFFFFKMLESPKYLVSMGRHEEAIAVLDEVARQNKTQNPLRIEHLNQVDADYSHVVPSVHTRKEALKRMREQLKMEGTKHLRALFAHRKNAYSMAVLMLIWAMIGIASPLYFNFIVIYLARAGAQTQANSVSITYRNNFIVTICSIPGSLLSGVLIQLPRFGRRGSLCTSLVLTGVFLFAFTTARTQAGVLAFNCIINFVSYIFWGVLYCYTAEVLPSAHRGTGYGLVSCANRFTGLIAPIIFTFATSSVNAPLFVCATLYLVAGMLCLAAPYEPQGKASI